MRHRPPWPAEALKAVVIGWDATLTALEDVTAVMEEHNRLDRARLERLPDYMRDREAELTRPVTDP